MKKHLLTLTALSLFAVTAFGQAKKPKTYNLGMQLDSAQTVNVIETLQKAYICLDASSAPHHDVNESMTLVLQLKNLFIAEKKQQDTVKVKVVTK